jgi:hypothetical protein
MSIPSSLTPLFSTGSSAAAAPVQIERSLRFNSADSAFLSRTPGTAGNRRTFTFSTWVKRSKLSSGFQQLICSYDGSTGSTYFSLIFTPSDTIRVEDISVNYRETTQVFRDASAWYCIQLAVDTTQATAANRIKLYVNGSEVTTFATTNNPTQNTDFGINNTVAHAIGRSGAQSAYYQDGYLADIHFIDGQALTPSSFTEVSATTGRIEAKLYAGSFGTNGFWLPFNNNSTAAALGTDYSGNSNTWTVNNLSVTAGAGNDSLVDTPTSISATDTGVGGEIRGNYATFNALALNGNTLSNGNLDYLAGGNNKPTLTTIGIPASGKWYIEITDVNSSSGAFIGGVGTASANVGTYLGADANGWSYQTHASSAGYFNNNIFTTTGRINGHGSNTILGIAIDRDAQKIWFAINGTFVNSGAPASGTNAQYSNLPTSGELFAGGSAATGQNITFNGGQRAFAYTAPSGFKALCDTNLGAPVVAKPNTLFDVVKYDGTGAAQSITGLAFNPDFVWLKRRDSADSHQLFDIIRGATNFLGSDTTNAEQTLATLLTSFNSDGFSIGSYYPSSSTWAAWAWDAGTSTDPSNTAGSITSQVRANVSAGFSVATWTGTGSGSATVGHGLGVAPRMMIVKDRSNARNWLVYHTTLGASSGVALNSTGAASGADAGWWNNTSPTSTVATIGTYGNESANYVGYFWTPVVGYSSMGSYVGNGSSDGSFVYTGFRPRWILVKASSFTQGWALFDTARSTYNASSMVFLQPNTSNSESTTDIDILSNGFKARANDGNMNGSGQTYIYYAVAENPFQYARAR